MAAELYYRFGRLTDFERRVLLYRHMKMNGKRHSTEETARHFGIKRSEVNKITTKVLGCRNCSGHFGKLEAYFDEKLDDYLDKRRTSEAVPADDPIASVLVFYCQETVSDPND